MMTIGCDQRNRDDPDCMIRLRHRILPDGSAVIAISGDLDLATAGQTVRYVTEIIDSYDGPVTADLGGLTFCDACGLGALIRISRYAQRSGRLFTLSSPPQSLTRIMRITGVDTHLLAPAPARLGTGLSREQRRTGGDYESARISGESVSRSLRLAR
jgi:anti-sigma B factor antagonist